LHKTGILRKKGQKPLEKRHAHSTEIYFARSHPKLEDGGGCGGGVSEIANVFSELISDWILKILNAAAFVIDATVAKKKNLKPLNRNSECSSNCEEMKTQFRN
jgi:hypothetical protein